MEEEENAGDLNPLCSLFLHECTPNTSSNLTPPSLLVQGRRSQVARKPRSSSATAIAQICTLAPKTSMPTISEVPVERCAAPPPRRRRGKPLGEPPCPPDPPRVSAMFPPRSEVGDDCGPSILTRSDGQRRPVPLRPLLPLATGPRLAARLESVSRARPSGLGRPRPRIGPALLDSGLRCFFYYRKLFNFLVDLLVCKNYRKIITGPN
jgi:hypothetical protein